MVLYVMHLFYHYYQLQVKYKICLANDIKWQTCILIFPKLSSSLVRQNGATSNIFSILPDIWHNEKQIDGLNGQYFLWFCVKAGVWQVFVISIWSILMIYLRV